MTDALFFLVSTVIKLYLMVVVLRLWLQAARADFYNPFSQFIVKATNPVVIPLRRFLPSLGGFDTGTWLLAFVICLLHVSITQFYQMGQLFVAYLPLGALVLLVTEILQLLFWILVIRALLSWFSQGNNPMELVLMQLTEPLLHPIRRVIPSMGGLDLSVLVLLLGLQFVQILLQNLLRGF
ncbi:YggT family protein [Rheinheimera marina]|uniref:YggT family protein n=1 Tax=Rheinheimera marina TaxID=1774958 RepID=A0ABV9JK01_9GAMM